MSQVLLVLLVLSHFIAGLPKSVDFKNSSRADVVKMYSAACLNFYKRPETKDADLSGIVQTIIQSLKERPQNITWLEGKGSSAEVIEFYEKVCKESPDLAALDGRDGEISQALTEYQDLISTLPNVGDLHKLKLVQATDLISSDNKVVTDLSVRGGRRRFVPLSEIPPILPKILVAVEDNRFFEHAGIDELGILRSVLKDITKDGARQGASTIDQQVARNLFLSPEQSMKRKLQEILITKRINEQLTKNEILEIYLNLIYFGRNSWGIEKAAQSYFNKNARNLNQIEAAFLIGIIHGPNLYRNRSDRVDSRVKFVLTRMQDAKILPIDADLRSLMNGLKVSSEVDPYNSGYFRDYLIDQVKSTNPEWLTSGSRVRTSIDAKMQLITNQALQDGLVGYERGMGRRWDGPIDNIQEAIERAEVRIAEFESLRKTEQEKSKKSLFSAMKASPKSEENLAPEKPWHAALLRSAMKYPVPVVSWTLAVLLSREGQIGLLDGREAALSRQSLAWASQVEKGDLLYVRPAARQTWEIMQPPEVNGAAVIMDTSGRILSMVGGFSHSISGYNRASQASRQPGSLMKPFTYLAALQSGIQPNRILSDQRVALKTAGGRSWSPVNYGGGGSVGDRPMRWALENSRNVMTTNLMTLIGLDPIRRLTEQFGLYENAIREYSFILGSQETTLLSLVKSYAEIANGGFLVTPQSMDQITDLQNNTVNLKKRPSARIEGVDAISMFQLQYLLSGVVERGTAASLSRFSGVVAGKTGTSNESKDVWFVGFTEKLVIGVFVGYDTPETLGGKTTGGSIAVPIFDRIFSETIKKGYLPGRLPPPPAGVVLLPTHKLTGEVLPAMTKDTVLEAYREGASRKER